MNRNITRYKILSVAVAILMSSCSDDLNLYVSGYPVPVVYSLINPDDSVHYVRLTRTISGSQQADILAKDSSLLYYSEAEVNLEIVSDQGWPIKYASFEPIEGPKRESGTFFESPNRLYRLKANLKNYLLDHYTIRLIVSIPDEQKYCSASVQYFTPPEILLPTPSRKTQMNLYYGEPLQIKWEDKYGYSYYQVIIRFNYTDFFKQDESDTDSLATSASASFYQKGKGLRSDEDISYLFQILDGDAVLKLLAQNIKNVNRLDYRKFTSFDIVILSASSSFGEYLDSYEITADRLGLPVSNIADGIGLFSIISTSEHDGYLLDKPSMDSLCNGQYTKNLGFVNW